MKNIKQIREQFDLITEKEEKEGQKLSALVRAGLYDAKKLPALKKALEKSADKMTSQEKRMLLNLLDSLISQVVSDDQVYRKVRQNVHSMNEAKAKEDYLSKFDPRFKAGYPSDRDIPSVLILKRKAIRVYPDNQKVALYYSQALDKYVTIPFSDIQLGINEEVELTEETSEERKKRIAAETPEEKKKRITAALAGGSRTGKMLRTGKVLPSKKSLRSRIRTAAKNISDVSQRSGASIAAGVATGNILKAGLKGLGNAFRVYNTEKKLKARLTRKQGTKTDTPSVPQPVVSTPSTPTKNKRKETKASIPTATPTLKTRSPKAAAKIMAANPNINYSAAAKKHAGITENNRYDGLDEANNVLNDKSKFNPRSLASRIRYQGALASKKVKPFTPAKTDKIKPEPGNYTVNKIKDKAETFARAATGDIGDVVGLTDPKRGEGLRKFNPGAAQTGDLAGAALTIGTGPSRATLKGAEVVASAANKADKVADVAKTANKADKVADVAKTVTKTKKGKGKFSTARNLTQKVLRLAGRATKLGLAGAALTAGAAGSAGGNDNSYVLSKSANPQLGKSSLFKSGSGFSQAQDSKKATAERTRQAQFNALTTEQQDSYVLSKGKDPKFGLKARTSGSKRTVDPRASTNERIRQRQIAALTATNESVIDTLKNMVANNIQETNISFNEKEITINNTVAKKLLNVYESINKSNKKKMEQMLNESATSFNKVLTFSVRQ